MTRVAWSKLSNNIEDSQQQFEKKTFVSINVIKLILLNILIEFFISVNYEFSQIALLEDCTQGILNINHV